MKGKNRLAISLAAAYDAAFPGIGDLASGICHVVQKAHGTCDQWLAEPR